MTIILGAALIGCGGSDEEEGATDSGAGTTGGTGGNYATGGTGGATGGTGGTAGIDGGFQSNCDTTVVSATTCGTETCPPLDTTMPRFTCQVNCCLNDKCGTRMAYANAAQSTECTLGAQVDTRCEDITLSLGATGGTRTYVGCCTADNQCGGISTVIANICVSRSQLQQFGYSGVPAPRACDAAVSDSGA